ncbi:MAG TPA: ATP-binding protein [Usitatibacter sp.]|nr:ATP-binding protein [Usitatibacter sp.]
MSFPLNSAQRLASRIVAGRRWVVLAMLLALHAALVSEPGEIFQRLWLLVHFGLFLLWQPFFATERELDVGSVAMLLALPAAILYFLAGWMIVMWLLLLLGILGGRVFTVHVERRNRFYLVAFAYVLTMLLLWTIPALIIGEQEIPENVARFLTHVIPLGLAALVLLPFPKEDDAGQVFDFFYAVMVFQLCVVLVLGSMVLMRFTDGDYVSSVVLTVTGFGLALFVFAVLWNPMRGFGGLRTYFSTYLMSVGMPFELWMRRIAELAETEPEPRRFLEQALGEIAALPWVRGGHWKSPDGEGRFGGESEHSTRFTHHGLEIVFHTAISMSPALFLHMRLLAQVVGEFYEGKRRESALRRHSYLQAVHETGARLTHDMKNLLQSLFAITSMAPKEPAEGYTGLLQRQLPQLSKRLQSTLEKLRSPEIAASDLPVRATQWWSEVERRFAGGDIALEAAITADGNLPAGLFDAFTENAIDNARAKALREPGIAIRMRFALSAARASLTVCDDGSAVPEPIAQKLFREPIERGYGLGIGLYHVARMAAQAGYSVRLAENRANRVCFVLEQDAGSAPGQG